MTESLQFKPHARLLTMLGDQLIKSDRVALVEVVKNSYDADAANVWVDFRAFGPEFERRPESTIVITDDGEGMSQAILREAWMRPATPEKLRRKLVQPKTPRGRALQGEKGIGRFAVFKLGSRVALTTRVPGSPEEANLVVDVSMLDEEEDRTDDRSTHSRASGAGDSRLLLEDIPAHLTLHSPQVFRDELHPSHGTRVEIGEIRSAWTLDKVHTAFRDLERLQPLMWTTNDELEPDFRVHFTKDGADLDLGRQRDSILASVLDRAVLRVTSGYVDTESRVVGFDLNGKPETLALDSGEIRGLRPFRDHFIRTDDAESPTFACGSFGFEFYIFDFSSIAPSAYQLDRQEKEAIREHRVYLYRDGVRVYPYGDPDDDWLQIDVIRGTQSARSMFSNDQTVGYVAISQADNPRLRDKTNREGLLDAGAATGDFVALVQTVLAYLRSKPYQRYAEANRRVRDRVRSPSASVDAQLEQLRSTAVSADARRLVEDFASSLASERQVAQMQIARTQDLAGVGLSVESASHDLIASGAEALRLARLLLEELRQLGLVEDYAFSLARTLIQRLEFVDSRFQDVQGLFVSTRQKRGVIDVVQVARKVKSMYSALHRSRGIELTVDEGTKLSAVTTEGAVLQAVINLVDNATYWLMVTTGPRREIRVFAPRPGVLAISDSGPGVAPADEPYIFEAFYSGKGESGKGLGLFIAKEVGARNGFEVSLAGTGDSRELSGATFTLRFAEAVS